MKAPPDVSGVALIVGGAGGIGWATAQLLLESGHWVVVADLAEAVASLTGQERHPSLHVHSGRCFVRAVDRSNVRRGPQ